MTDIVKGQIGNALESVAPDGIVATADAIYDETKGKYQEQINAEVGDGLNAQYHNTGYYECRTEAATAAKSVTASGYQLPATAPYGGSIKVKFTHKNSAANPTLSINQSTPKPIYYNGAIASASNTWDDNDVLELYYDGTKFNAKSVVEKFATGEKVKNVGIDSEPTVNSNNLVKSGGVQNELALGAVYDVSAKNPTAGPNNDGKWESLSALLSDVNLNTLVPTAVRKGGMSIKFVYSSDNKYVQFRCMANAFTTDVTQWQGVDDEPTAGSNNLVKSGGVVAAFKKIDLASTNTYYGIINIISDISFISATLKQYYNRDRQSLPAQSSQVFRVNFVTEANETLTFIYTYEGGPQLTGIQELTKTISGHIITIRVDWQPINAELDIPIDVTRIINTTHYNTKILEKSNSYIFKDSSVSIDFGIKSIYTDFEFSSIRLSQYYNRDRTSLPAQSSQVLTFYVTIDGVEQRFVYTYEGGPQLTSNQDIELVNNGKHIYVNLDWKAINQELSNYYLLKGNIQQLYKLPTEVVKESDFSLVPGVNIANPSNIIGKAVIDVRDGTLYIRDNLDGNFVIKINVSEGQVISFGHFTLGRTGGYTFYNSSNPTGNYAGFADPQGGKAVTVTVPSGANILYIQVHNSEYPSADYSQIMANYGNDLANYEPFGEEIELIKGYKIKGTGESQGQSLSQLVIDLPVSDGTNIQSGYAYIDNTDRCVKVKA